MANGVTRSAANRHCQPRSAYIHIPFCRHRCGYCNFSVVSGRDELIDRFLDAIDKELALLERPTLDTLFVGGGTPTHLDERQTIRLLEIIHARFELEDGAELTVEANPEDIRLDGLKTLRSYGVNRISLGVQSFHKAKIDSLERSHDGGSASLAIERCAEVIGNTSIDLIFGAPGEDLMIWKSDLDAAFRLPICHLSTYALTIEKGTRFFARRQHGKLARPTEDLDLAMYEAASSASKLAGMTHYEISSFAKRGARCRHNLAYWKGEGWYAAGPGAARFVYGVREVNHRSPTTYLKRIEAGDDPTT
ncbi:MAG: radical SAM family heme chaperone HemW, partial [Planctomycetota bacterium]